MAKDLNVYHKHHPAEIKLDINSEVEYTYWLSKETK